MGSHSGKKNGQQCEQCGVSCKDNGQLKRHIYNHHMEGVYKFHCQYCYRGFKEKFGLKLHEKTHTGEKPFECTDCPLKFLTKRQLSQHYIVKHTNEKPFPCDQCDKKYGSKMILVSHKRRVHLELFRLLPCSFCDLKFKTKQNLAKHERTHTKREAVPMPGVQQDVQIKSHLTLHEATHSR